MASRRQCKRAIEIHEEMLSNQANVVGSGVIKIDETRKKAEYAIAVYVTHRRTKSTIPKMLVISGRGRVTVNVPIRVIEIGETDCEAAKSDANF